MSIYVGVVYRDVALTDKHHLTIYSTILLILYEYCKTLNSNLVFQQKLGEAILWLPNDQTNDLKRERNGL